MTMLLIAGIVVLAAGVLSVVFGVPVKEFSLGNTLILAGTIAASAGLVLIGLSMVVRELRNIVRLAGGSRARVAPELAAPAAGNQAPSAPDRGEPGASPPASPGGDALADRTGEEAIAASAEPAPAKPRRNLLFSSSRRERERATAGVAAPTAPEPAIASPAAASAPKETAPATFDDAWPQSERGRSDPALRRARTPSASSAGAAAERPAPEPPAARSEEPPPVTVLKSGVVDGMAYSLYSDGSIEAQMPEGMMRFASIDELRSHLDQRS